MTMFWFLARLLRMASRIEQAELACLEICWSSSFLIISIVFFFSMISHLFIISLSPSSPGYVLYTK